MSMIKIENLTFSYPDSYDDIFQNISLLIDTDWKLGLVGRNGRGKTTLLRLMLGQYAFHGRIMSSVQFDYFPYRVEDRSQLTYEILLDICSYAQDWEILREFSYLEVDENVLWKPFELLSNGEQVKALLAALFLNEGHFLLIDEPTNHLDRHAREIVSQYLQKKKGFILVSHDRYFLDSCVDHIMSINKTNIEIQKGCFSSWFGNFENQQRLEMLQNEQLKKDIKRLKQAAKRSAIWSDKVEASKIGAYDKGYVGHKAAKMMKRSKAIEGRKQQAIEQKTNLLKNEETTDHLKITPLISRGELLRFSHVSIQYDQHIVCHDVSLTLHSGDRIALDGKNGCGKSSLLKLILKEPVPYQGVVTMASGLVISYVPQDTSHLKGTLSAYANDCDIDESLFKAILRKMGFERVHFEKNMQDFSDGQKKKVLIARSLCQSAHLYIWDEPLNFIDIYSRIQIENLIKRYVPTMIFVEHDKVFTDEIATCVISIS